MNQPDQSDLPSLITKALDEHEKIIVFTQEWAQIRKSILNDKRTEFSTNPFSHFKNESFVIKTWFKFPRISITDHYPPIIAIQKEGKQIVIKTDGSYQYNALHDQFTMQGIIHSLESSGDFGDIHLVKTFRILPDKYRTVIVYGKSTLEELIPFSGMDKIILVREEDLLRKVKFPIVSGLLKCFTETPDSAIGLEYLNFKTFLHPKTLESNLLFLEHSGCISKVRADEQKVIIHKKGTIPDDLEFHAIPEGEYKISTLVTHLRIQREDLFPLLKKYENNGLIFSYSPGNNVRLWKYNDELTYDLFRKTIDRMQEEAILLDEIINVGELAINRFLDQKIEQYCLREKAQAILLGEDGGLTEINPRSKSMAG